MKLSRRRVIQGLAALGVAGAGDWKLLATEPHLNVPKKAQDRLSVTSYPFRAFIDAPDNAERDRTKPGMDLKVFAARVVEKWI
jgi:hypothetical protein